MDRATDGAGGDSKATARDPERFNCPFPGCNRSFAELWRLKVHYRAPPDVRGSGKERGHGTELAFCPKCGRELKPGKHHVGCSAGKSTTRVAKKLRREASDVGKSKAGSKPNGPQHAASTSGAGRGDDGEGPSPSPPPVMMQNGLPMMPGHHPHGGPPAYYICAPGPNGMAVWQGPPGGYGGPGGAPAGVPMMSSGPMMMQPGHPMPQMVGHPASTSMHHSSAPLPEASHADPEPDSAVALLDSVFDDDDGLNALHQIPSPPPLPDDWADQPMPAAPSNLFDFGQFQNRLPGVQPAVSGSNKLVKDSTDEARDLAEANVVYETQDDGDMMKLLFGVADEMPTMATIHLHKFPTRSNASFSAKSPTPGSPQSMQRRGTWHSGDTPRAATSALAPALGDDAAGDTSQLAAHDEDIKHDDPLLDVKHEVDPLDTSWVNAHLDVGLVASVPDGNHSAPVSAPERAHHSEPILDDPGKLHVKSEPGVGQLLNGDLLHAADSPSTGGLLWPS